MSSTTEPVPADAGERLDTLGTRLRQARLDAHLSLRELARQLGVSASFVSQIENGKSQPSVATLYSFTQLLGVSMDRLFAAQDGADEAVEARTTANPDTELAAGSGPARSDDAGGAGHISRSELASPSAAWGDRSQSSTRLSVTTPGNRTRLVMDCGVTWDQLARKSEHLDFMEIVYPPGSSSTTDGRMLRHDDYEYGYLLEGELQVTLGFDVFMLRAGEAIGFDSSVPHLFRNLGTTAARGIWVVHHRHD